MRNAVTNSAQTVTDLTSRFTTSNQLWQRGMRLVSQITDPAKRSEAFEKVKNMIGIPLEQDKGMLQYYSQTAQRVFSIA